MRFCISRYNTYMPAATNIPIEARRILDTIANTLSDARIYVVGGTVRDMLMRRPTKDVDIVIGGASLKTIANAVKVHGKVHTSGSAFGVVTVTTPQSLRIDIALPREEQAFGTGGYRDFSFSPNPGLAIEEDLGRRDFTINAMALDWRTKMLIDPYGGQSDLRSKRIRAVGTAMTRFSEDYSRILRMMRMAVELEFTIELDTYRAAKRKIGGLIEERGNAYIVPREVIAEQLVRMFLANPLTAFDLCDDSGLFRVLIPEVNALKGVTQGTNYHSEGDVYAHTRLALEAFAGKKSRKPIDPTVLFAVIFHDLGKPATHKLEVRNGKRFVHFYGHERLSAELTEEIAARLKLSSYKGLIDTSTLVWLVRSHMISIGDAVSHMKPSTLEEYFCGQRGAKLLQLIRADQSASLRADGTPSLEMHRKLEKRLARLFRLQGDVFMGPSPLVSGGELIKKLSLAEGPVVGHILAKIREEQLTGSITTKAGALRLAKQLIQNAHEHR